jgi:fluoride ion exporter CrcB/FEX
MMMLRLFRMARPFAFFLLIGIGLVSCALALSIPIFMTYLDTGLVPRIPTAILATGLVLLGALSAFSGLVLDTVAHGRREAKMLAYLSIPHDPVA